MSDDFDPLERQLRGLRPLAPSATLLASLDRELSAPVAPAYRTATSWTSWKWANWGVAAALALVAVLGSRYAPLPPAALLVQAEAPPLPATTYRPVGAERLLLGTTDLGVITLADGTTVRRLRDDYVDTVTWRRPDTDASFVVTVPRADIRFQQLAFY